jgi:GTP-binding protein
MKHFRREKYVPRGGPDGGDGGRGGDVILAANAHLNTLNMFNHQRHFNANNGKPGGIKNQTGARGKSVRVEVPVGTVIRSAETGEILADLLTHGQEFTAAKGGRGGLCHEYQSGHGNGRKRRTRRGAQSGA